jgi:DNA topoisomerase-2
MTKHIAQTYQVLDEIDHIRKRTGMYAGSTSVETSLQWVYDIETKKMAQREISVIPAFVKIFSEILDNAIDESRRAPDVLDSIRVAIEDDGSISITDNGRGIPVEIHPDTQKYVAETVFSNLRAGSNFNDEEDQQLIGTNGVGSTLTNVLSTSFKIESCDGKKLFRQEFFEGMRERTEPKITPHDKHYTKITFTPDYEFFKLKGLDEDHKLRMIKKVVDAAATNAKVKFYVNGERIMTRAFDDYIAMYADEYVYDDTTNWKVGISKSDGFEQIGRNLPRRHSRHVLHQPDRRHSPRDHQEEEQGRCFTR